MDRSQGLIFLAVGVMAASTLVKQIEGGSVSFRPYVGASFVGITLTAIGIGAPKIADNLAILIILGLLLRDNGAIFGSLGKIVPNTTSKKG